MVSRATIYRTLRRLADHGLVHHSGETWTLAPRALEGFGSSSLKAATDENAKPAQGWDSVAKRHGTTGVAAQRKALHAAERAAYRDVLARLSENGSKAAMGAGFWSRTTPRRNSSPPSTRPSAPPPATSAT
ncbi:UNVERIFIED_CONTAM: hypothetical protein RKD50_000268 [Streptomyces canus]